ncbi:MAG: ribosome-associated protein [Flavobacteriales bacterium]|jgi:ribosome-associated protein
MEFKLDKEFLELIRVLKYMNFVQSGGEAKMVVTEGLVFVNGEQEFRKRRKIRLGDKIEFDGRTIEVIEA